MKIAIGSDHAGFEYKEELKRFLSDLKIQVIDFGPHSNNPVDYPIYARAVAQSVAKGECDRGIILGGSGNGEAIAANRTPGVRCALCWNTESARLSRIHNDSNMISLGQRMMKLDVALQIVNVWLTTAFEGGRHEKRIAMIDQPDLNSA